MESDIITQDLDSLLSTLKESPNDYKTMVDILRYLRQTKLRRSELAMQIAHKLLQDSPSILSQIEGNYFELHSKICSMGCERAVVFGCHRRK